MAECSGWGSVLKRVWGGEAGSSYFKLLPPPLIRFHFFCFISYPFYDPHIIPVERHYCKCRLLCCEGIRRGGLFI